MKQGLAVFIRSSSHSGSSGSCMGGPGSGGNRRKPRALKQAQGTLQRFRDNVRAPKLGLVRVPAAPAELDELEKRVWLELSISVDLLEIYTNADLTAFRVMVSAVADTRRELPIERRQTAFSKAWASLSQFGLTPAARDKVSTITDPEAQKTHDFLFGPLTVLPGGEST